MKCLMLVEKSGQRFIGELDAEDVKNDDLNKFDEDLMLLVDEKHMIPLGKVYEMMRAQVMVQGPQGPVPETRFMLLPVGIDGPRPWCIMNPDGFRVVEDDDSIQRAYRDARANDAGITLAPANVLPKSGPGLVLR